MAAAVTHAAEPASGMGRAGIGEAAGEMDRAGTACSGGNDGGGFVRVASLGDGAGATALEL